MQSACELLIARPEAVAVAVAAQVRREALSTHRLDSCIYTVSLLEESLKLLFSGVEAPPRLTPVAVELTVLNPVALRYVQAHNALPDNAEEAVALRDGGGWIVRLAGKPGVDYSGPDCERYPGHLVLCLDFSQSGGDSWMIDPSIDQANRPEKGISLELCATLAKPTTDGLGQHWQFQPQFNDCLVVYEQIKSPAPWKSSPDWRLGKATGINLSIGFNPES
jgi:hypothetical protein